MSRGGVVGGEFCPESPGAAPQRSLGTLVDDLAASGSDGVLLASAREALRAWLRRGAEDGRDQLLVPAYICPAVLEAVIGTGTRWTVHFLTVGDGLAPVPESVTAAARQAGRRGCLLAAPLFGAPYPRDVVDAYAASAELGAEVCWDVTHGLLSAWAGAHGPIRVASLRKWCGLPDGAVVTGLGAMDCPAIDDGDDFIRGRTAGMEARARFLDAGIGTEDAFLATLHDAEAALSRASSVRGISARSRGLLAHVDVEAIAARRRANATTLIADLGGTEGITALVGAPENGVVPLTVPILVDHRDGLRRYLASNRVFAPIHWTLPTAVRRDRFPREHTIAERMLSIPCDQRLDEEDMARVGVLIRDYIASTPATARA